MLNIAWGYYINSKDMNIEFINRALDIHGELYDYSLVEYKNISTKVELICKEHGSFFIRPSHHIYRKQGCPVCAGRHTYRSYTLKASEIHDFKYDYTKTIYTGSKNDVVIICPIHGEFSQRADHHLAGRGCKACAYDTLSDKFTYNTETFIRKARKVHKNKYDYSNTVYNKSCDVVEIICPLHGSFYQQPNNHLSGKGCIECAKTNFCNPIDYSIAFDTSNIYIINVFNDFEHFYKVGIANNGVKRRFCESNMPYNYEVIREVKMSGYNTRMCELELHRVFKDKKYVPNVWFRGHTECFESLDFELVDTVIDWFKDPIQEG